MRLTSIYYALTTGSIRLAAVICCLVVAATASITALAHDISKYAASSALSVGNWAKVDVKATGMQFVSDVALRQLGLDPAKTKVYGYGGRQRPDRLGFSEPDDLPRIASVKVNGGLLFFGTDNITWTENDLRDGMTYAHLMHPYSSTSTYFLSDREWAGERGEEADSRAGGASSADYSPDPTAQPARTFRARLLHEEELTAPSNSGRILLGEDFRVRSTQSFPFELAGLAGEAKVRVRFGGRFHSGQATAMFWANGKQLPSASTDVLSAIVSESQFLKAQTTVKTIEDPQPNFSLQMKFTATGTIDLLALDYIEAEYERSLTLEGGWLHFYGPVSGAQSYEVAGVTATTRFWDVTDPSRPLEFEPQRSGSTARFTVRGDGLREFVAFDPSAPVASWLKVSEPRRAANQNIHALGNPHMLVISPARYLNQANEVAELHRQLDGMTVEVLTPEAIYNEFSSGSRDAGAFRKLLKMWRDRSAADPSLPSTDYCLIIGRATFDNKQLTPSVKKAGYPFVPIWQSTGTYSDAGSYSTDDYIGMTDDSDDHFDIGSQKVRVAVGRWPVKGEDEASVMVEKLTRYLTDPDYGIWRNQVMLIADDQDRAQHLDQMESAWSGMSTQGNGARYRYEKLYLDSYPLVATATGPTYPAAKKKMLQVWNDGCAWIQYVGHANPRSWSHEQLMTWTDITGFSNSRLPFLYAATCEFARHDAIDASGAEVLVLNPTGGLIGTISPSRTVYIPQNGTLTRLTGPAVFGRRADGKANRVGDVFLYGKNLYPGSDTNKLRYSLLCDPALGIPNPDLQLVVDAIDGQPVEGLAAADYPVLAARQKVVVTGHVALPTGEPVEFDGELQALLYDAEKVVTTRGNGKDGKVSTYNDRNTRLYSGATRVKGGRWELSLLMPGEIENNFSPAMLSLYAHSPEGKEAMGSCERIYVYGLDASADEDLEGPSIDLFTLNGPAFTPGDVTHSSPLVLATFSDPSGINVSEAGLGHSLMLTLDGKHNFTDLERHYSPSPDREGEGAITYPLPEVEPGEHTLTLTVWDNAGNSSTATLPFSVGLGTKAQLVSLKTDANPAREKVTFTVTTDRVANTLAYNIEVFDLNGHEVWSTGNKATTRGDGSLAQTWYLTDKTGRRVERGIYLCRATVETSEGAQSSKTIRLAVAKE